MASTSRSRDPSALASRRDALLADARAGRIRRVLAIRFARLGDVIFTTPALSLLRERVPGVRIDYLAGGPGGALVRHHPAVDEIVVFRPEEGIAAIRRLMVAGFSPAVAWSDANTATTSGDAGSAPRPCAAHQATKIAQSDSYARRVAADRAALA